MICVRLPQEVTRKRTKPLWRRRIWRVLSGAPLSPVALAVDGAGGAGCEAGRVGDWAACGVGRRAVVGMMMVVLVLVVVVVQIVVELDSPLGVRSTTHIFPMRCDEQRGGGRLCFFYFSFGVLVLVLTIHITYNIFVNCISMMLVCVRERERRETSTMFGWYFMCVGVVVYLSVV